MKVLSELHKFSSACSSTFQDQGNEVQRDDLIQGHTTRMAEPGLQVQVYLASKCILPAIPHCFLDPVPVFENISSKPFRTYSDKPFPFLFLCPLLSIFLSLFFLLSLCLLFLFLALHCSCCQSTNNT